MRSTTLLLLLATAACTGRAPTPAPAPAPDPAPHTPTAVVWARESAEHDALFQQVYRAATDRVLALAPGRASGSWGVILDADETVLDNSEYQLRLAQRGTRFSSDTWNEWVRERAADPLPGAAEFIGLVRSLGGVVAIVTNRDAIVCPDTEANLAALGIAVDVVLCQQPGERGKNARFQAVQRGTTPADLPAVEVLLWIGDNIRDFPDLDQGQVDADALARFGRSYFLLPNAMYGSWERR